MMRRFQEIKGSTMTDLRIVLLGKTGSGKSSTGNTLLNRDAFKSEYAFNPVTGSCQKEKVNLGEWTISVTDTPGIFEKSMTPEELKDKSMTPEELKDKSMTPQELKDKSMTPQELKDKSMTPEELKDKSMTPEELKAKSMTPEELHTEIEKCVEMSVPGPHVFLLVIRLDVRITDEEMNAVKCIQKNFGEDAVKYTMILFTHADVLKDKTLEEFFKQSNDIKALLNQYGSRYHSFNNNDRGNQDQVRKLLEKIDEMVKGNGGMYYTNDMYKEAQRRIDQENFRRKAIEYGTTALTVVGVLSGGAAVVKGAVAIAGAAGTAEAAAAAAAGLRMAAGAVTAVVAKVTLR
ncbi:GTPase IMAP family member 7 [Triplophysa tibetana]|uniref:GTPase IMAP family member 7 n=1 Tax=Triplophysa tibetana TaxID=1572043 RepID=A0A5A9PLY0_9TELE|nr:GTPase IMAP family member 7 [Triplophysa tibetana]